MAVETYDVVVVGGGPAGSMAARAAAEKGAKVLVLERDAHIGLPVRCGEAVNIHNVGRFVKIDKRWIAVEVDGMVMYAPDGTAVPVVSQGEVGTVLERCLFDRYLAELAAAAGVHIRTRCDVDGLIFNDAKVIGLYYSRLGKRYNVHSGVVIAADGVESRIGRWAGIRTQVALHDYESAYQKVLSGIDFDHRKCHFYFGNDIAPGGYIWIFPKGEHTASVGIGVKTHLCDPGEAYRKLDVFIKHRFGNPAVVGEMAGGVPCSLPLKKPYTDGLILAGDAARHCNPLTGGGIYTAMVSGSHAGEVAAEAVAKGDVSENAFKLFDRRIEADINVIHKRAYKLSEVVSKLSDDVLNVTAHEILSLPPDQRTLKRIFLRGLIAYPKMVVDIVRAFV